MRAPAADRGTRLPPDWTLPKEWEVWARSERPDVDPAAAAERFADYWRGQPGKQGRKADWLATWRNWVRNERAGARAPAPARATSLSCDEVFR